MSEPFAFVGFAESSMWRTWPESSQGRPQVSLGDGITASTITLASRRLRTRLYRARPSSRTFCG